MTHETIANHIYAECGLTLNLALYSHAVFFSQEEKMRGAQVGDRTRERFYKRYFVR